MEGRPKVDGRIRLSPPFQKLSRCVAAAGAGLRRQLVAASLRNSLALHWRRPHLFLPATAACIPLPLRHQKLHQVGKVRPRASDPGSSSFQKMRTPRTSHVSEKEKGPKRWTDVLVVRLPLSHTPRILGPRNLVARQSARERWSCRWKRRFCSMTCACAWGHRRGVGPGSCAMAKMTTGR